MTSEFIPDATKEVKLIPKDLQDQWGACQAVSTALAVFDQGYFSPRHVQFIQPTMAFLAKLHEQTVEGALKHPQAHMIPELKQILDKKDSKDGEKDSDH